MNKYSALCLLMLVPFLLKGQHADDFAKIGARAYNYRTALLKENLPPQLPDKVLPLNRLDPKAVFRPLPRLDSPAKLARALDSIRNLYKPFMQNLAPTMASMRQKIPLTTFQWRIETPEDRRDFNRVLSLQGEWRKVEIPHYGPPLGKAAAYYATTVQATQPASGKAAFICFKGADYIAEVFVNGAFVGRHEGFFAPFEFDISEFLRNGNNQIVVRIVNDYVMAGNKGYDGKKYMGDKIYAATGLGYDEPVLGWHHCPPAMGIYHDVWIEYRNAVYINDVFIRPLPEQKKAEIHMEIGQTFVGKTAVQVQYGIFGRNFADTVVARAVYQPSGQYIPGFGDMPKPSDWKQFPLLMQRGINFIKWEVPMPDFRYWHPDTPWLYQAQFVLQDEQGQPLDNFQLHFGMRSFRMDTLNLPKGRLFLNGQPIRLRGANTMGHIDNAAIRKDFDRLRDDILLAKIANMNFFRITQHIAPPEVYEYMDMLGLMAQSDLPMFGVVRRNLVPEVLRQAEAMERIVRKHPSNVIISYLNERFPNAEGDPHRHLNTPEEFDRLFRALDEVVLLQNPDRVIKHMDGDYDPPGPGLPDYHCYNGWYNGHGLGLGEMHKGYWKPTKPDWLYACGEFGAEGLDNLPVMQKYYPKEWLPASPQAEKTWIPVLHGTQTARFYPMWFAKQKSIRDWIEVSQAHQARMVRMTADALRRNPKVVSFAVHLFIDAWPNGWIKTIMDVDRQPKKAFYAYRDALQPLTVNLRTDRQQFWAGENLDIEAWIFNDLNQAPSNCTLVYQLESPTGKPLAAAAAPAEIPVNSSLFQGFIRLQLPAVQRRTAHTLRLGLRDAKGNIIAEHSLVLETFPRTAVPANALSVWFAQDNSQAEMLLKELGLPIQPASIEQAEVLMVRPQDYAQMRQAVEQAVERGAKALLIGWQEGEYEIAESKIKVFKPDMGSYYFTEPLPHRYTAGLSENDFRYWYNRRTGYFTPLLDRIMTGGEGWQPVLMSGNADFEGGFAEAFAMAEKKLGKGSFFITQLAWQDRLQDNPAAYLFWLRLLTQK